MAEPAVRRVSASGTDQSIGDLVSVAARDISQLVRYELDLAKSELKTDVKRVAIGGALMAIGGFAAGLILMVLCFAFAYGLNAGTGWPLWGTFLVVFGALVLLAIASMLVGYMLMRRLTGMTKTRRSLADGLSMLRRRRRPATTKAQARAG
jgi:Putative Actinobacterial Holin-X, holin superfamily III